MKSIWTICSKYSLEVSMEMNLSALCALVIVLLAFDLKIISAAETGGNSTVPILPKAGQCPRLLNVVPSQKGCFCDEDCPGDDKCCVFDCGAVCVPPAFTKPGVCPRRRWGSGMCAEFCSNDSDCPNDEKCCHNGCGHECIAPYTVKPGRCALPKGTPMCAEYCYHDGQCPEEQKCCRTTCGHACSEPCS
ncbi:WAP four-disulfide core domain protein 2-like [Oncorhynchus clarkii lewisi]|uniref:WAP four-disulfide core domain protein 2-like n=1 Tax=Oncorhynchus clarkii lewisi TaxID=490388 RepID=UPI0039B8F727